MKAPQKSDSITSNTPWSIHSRLTFEKPVGHTNKWNHFQSNLQNCMTLFGQRLPKKNGFKPSTGNKNTLPPLPSKKKNTGASDANSGWSWPSGTWRCWNPSLVVPLPNNRWPQAWSEARFGPIWVTLFTLNYWPLLGKGTNLKYTPLKTNIMTLEKKTIGNTS